MTNTTEYKEDWEKVEELAHAYQETFQPANDSENDYAWGEGFWKGIKFVKSCLPDLLTSQEQKVRQTAYEDVMSALEPYENSKWLNAPTPERLKKIILSPQEDSESSSN